MKRLLILSVFISGAFSCLAQKTKPDPLRVNEQVPAVLMKRLDPMGKSPLIILDFWSTYCYTCMAMFPRMDSLQNLFPNDLRIVMIDTWETGTDIKKRLTQINIGRKEEGYPPLVIPDAPQINGDSTIAAYFPAEVIPHHVWIYRGRVVAITYGHNATQQHVASVLRGESPQFAIKNDVGFLGYNGIRQGLLSTKHPGLSPAVMSAFFRYNSGIGSGGKTTYRDSSAGLLRKTWLHNSVLMLYCDAFGITTTNRVLVELPDSASYEYPDGIEDGDRMDEWNERNLFSYELNVPLSEERLMKERMQTDLNQFFRTEKAIQGRMETRTFDTYLLLVSDTSLPFKTKGGKEKFTARHDTLTFINQSLRKLNGFLSQLENKRNRIFFMDGTGLDPNTRVDFILTGDLSDEQNVRYQLKQQGLYLARAKRPFEVLVISKAH